MLHRTLQPSFHEGRLVPADSIVDIDPKKAGAHHVAIEPKPEKPKPTVAPKPEAKK